MATGSPEEIEEKRRLLYVAMARAKNALELITPHRFYVHGQAAFGDRHVYAARSRFLPDHVLGHFEQIAWAPAMAHGRMGPWRATPRDLRARMRDMF
jgi:DNA helicase II / ATP-dependent DNA helicase PcrA